MVLTDYAYTIMLFSGKLMSGSLQPHEVQHARLPHPSLSPRVYSNSCPLCQHVISIYDVQLRIQFKFALSLLGCSWFYIFSSVPNLALFIFLILIYWQCILFSNLLFLWPLLTLELLYAYLVSFNFIFCEMPIHLNMNEGQVSLMCFIPWGCKESDKTERLNWFIYFAFFSW